MEFGIFNSLYTPHQVYEDEADQWAVEAPAAAQRGRPGRRRPTRPASSTRGRPSTTSSTEYSHLSANEVFLGYLAGVTEHIHVGSGIFNITPPVNHPARVAERVAMLDHLSGGRFEFGVGRGSSIDRAARLRDPRPRGHRRRCSTRSLPEFKKMWRDERVPASTGKFFSMPPRNVLPKPLSDAAPADVGRGRQPGHVREGRRGSGSACCASRPARPKTLSRSSRSTRSAIDQAEPVGEYVNDNVMVTSQLLCLEDGQRARDIGAASMNGSYQNSLVFHYLDTFPKPPGLPSGPT